MSKFKKKLQKKSLSKRLSKLEREVKMDRPEMKVVENEIDAVVMTSTATTAWRQLTNIGQGVDEDDKVGRQVRLWRVRGKLNVEFRATVAGGATGYQRYRIMVVKDLAPDDVSIFPTPAEILQQYGAGPTTKVTSMKNYNRKERFKILWDKLDYVINEAGCDRKMRFYDINIPLNGYKQNYVSNVASATLLQDLYFVAIADAAADGPVITGQLRTYYTDA